jgi:hypothetical protein
MWRLPGFVVFIFNRLLRMMVLMIRDELTTFLNEFLHLRVWTQPAPRADPKARPRFSALFERNGTFRDEVGVAFRRAPLF